MGVAEEGKAAQAVSLPVTEANIASDWPAHGLVSFENVSVRYREGLPLVLRELTFTVQAGHRIGANQRVPT
jgi:ABC-type bacteriocin/lantibiotic exporter with double-glycine peptidase domain